jgi:hypothetical protein
MKNVFILLLPALLAPGCGRALTESTYTLELPDLPPAWQELLGSPRWRFEWINPQGFKEAKTAGAGVEIRIPQTWASPVSAWPFWPDRGIGPGIFLPAGGIFPHDASGAALRLSWRGGVDAFLYWELGAAWAVRDVEEPEPSVPRLPGNFDWPRFRELLEDPEFSPEVRADPWRVDWKEAAAGIVRSGFDRRRLSPEARTDITVPVPAGSWIGVSPFAPPLVFAPGIGPVFPAGSKPGSWFSPAGILRCSTEAWIFMPWPE